MRARPGRVTGDSIAESKYCPDRRNSYCTVVITVSLRKLRKWYEARMPTRAPARSAIYKGGPLLGLTGDRVFAGHVVFSCALGPGCLAAGMAGGAVRSRRGFRSV